MGIRQPAILTPTPRTVSIRSTLGSSCRSRTITLSTARSWTPAELGDTHVAPTGREYERRHRRHVGVANTLPSPRRGDLGSSHRAFIVSLAMQTLIKILGQQFPEPVLGPTCGARGHALELLYTLRRVWDVSRLAVRPGAFGDRITLPRWRAPA